MLVDYTISSKLKKLLKLKNQTFINMSLFMIFIWKEELHTSQDQGSIFVRRS